MIGILQSLPKTIHLSIAISVLLLLGLFFGGDLSFDRLFWSWLFRYFHVISGVMWIGLLWYLNFVQIPSMPKITDEQKKQIEFSEKIDELNQETDSLLEEIDKWQT